MTLSFALPVPDPRNTIVLAGYQAPGTRGADLQAGSWPQTELFAWLQKTAGIDDVEMNRTFNNGIGMVVVVAPEAADATAASLRELGETVYTIGNITARTEGAPVQVK